MGFLFPGSDFLLIVGVLLYFLYRYSTSTYNFWAERNVPFTRPLPFFGNTLKRFLGNGSVIEEQQQRYNFFGESRFGGNFIFKRPSLFIKDPSLVEQVLIKDFSTFYNRSLNSDPNKSPINRNLLTLQNSQWKTLRNKLTPLFSSGRMKSFQNGLIECSDALADHLSKYAETGEPFEARQVMSRFIIYAIGSIAFGLKLNTLEDPECQFGKMGEALFKQSTFRRILSLLKFQFPRFGGFIERAVDKVKEWIGAEQDYRSFFKNVVEDTLEYRGKHNIQRNDFMQCMMELHKQDKNSNDELKFDLDMMISSAFVFFTAGYDTTGATLSFMLYELAAHPDIQERLLQDILSALRKFEGVPTYEAVKEMKYLEQIISETLRMYPPIPSTFRVSRNPYQIPDTTIILPAGTLVTIPIYSLQRDPKNFPDPEVFNPDRFQDESQIIKGTYLPFGDGPRICIAQRLAKQELKLAVIKMVMHYKLAVNEKTRSPLELNTKSFFLNASGGIWLNLTKRV